ncbi:cubilin-like [Epargyreus clarus]|uniref:cubilin-like n=1 Tax=Epargyreus clarus TaxID=520877 RepID=UPI003C309BC0
MSTILIQYLFLVVWFMQLNCEVNQDRPKIKSSDGNLIIRPAFDKNIYLRLNGPQSGIFVGDVNLLQEIFSNRTIDHPLINDYQSITQVPDDIIRRLENLENVTSTLQNNLTYITFLSRRVNRLANRVSTLQTLLNSRRSDECESQPCEHGGTCLNLVNGYHCLCPSNWEGKNCEVDVNECRNFAGTDLGCQNGASCINRPGSYECICRPHWFGLHCTRKAKNCQEGDFEMCGHGICIKTDTGEGIKCICNQGWTTNNTGDACLTDVNECDSSQGPRCSINPKVDCINLPGSFRCGRCPPGYDGDGFVCYDIDECTTIPNGGCSTTPMVTCHNTVGSRVCGSCPPGYDGDGVTCTWRGSCFINHGGCHPSARCIDSSSFGLLPVAQCICPEGMIGNGIGIHGCYITTNNNVTQTCEGNPCGPNGQCHPLRAGYTCICFKGYRGVHCDNNDLCINNPCLNGGSCRLDLESETGFRCECTALYSGPICQMTSKPCGGVIDEEEGSIAYPISNTTYKHNSRCAWVIHTKPDKVINVTFNKFNLENHTDCLYDFLQIHDGRSSASQLIGRFCGSSYPNGGHILSSHNYLYFWFRSDQTVAKDGFGLHWTSVKPFCGGEIDATIHGHISSPGSPGKYPPNRDCYWQLTTNFGKRIQLHFFALDLERHPNCSFDFLAIYDGQHTTDPLLEKFCNSTQPAPIQSAGSEILIHFHSDAYGAGNGFQIAFAPIDGFPGCGGYYTVDKGEIISPSYNDKYLNNLLCDYKIKTSPETKIRINFKSFQLERSFRCMYDYLKIYDGPTSDSRLVGKYCGKIYPKSYTSSSNTLFLQFKTDHTMSSGGFRLTYESLCQISIVGDSGVLKSPGYPFSYPNNKICEYIIRTKPGRAILLMFQDFDIEDNNHFNCQYDNVEIRDGLDRNATLLGKFCGSQRIPPVQTSSLNYMYIRFNSDISVSGTGFYANFTTIDINCGGIYKEMSGIINHPSLNDTYRNEESCIWYLIAPEGMYIMLTWNRFDLENKPICNADVLELIEIDKDNISNTLGTYCGNTLPPALTVVSNRLMIKFHSDESLTGTGFSLSYTFLDEKSHCGGNYVKSQGNIYSPGWPHQYDSSRDCEWTITVPIGQQILLNITDFDLEQPYRNTCDIGDYLEIRNGPSNMAPLIGKYCGNIRQSKQIISTANTVHLHFHSDSYITGNGFKIIWDGSLYGCGGTLTGSSGSITSPNYPNAYNENCECFYKIVVSSGSRIRLSFADLQLERSTDCTDDYVEIFDGRDLNSASVGRFCHMSPNLKSIETTSNHAYIKFRSDYVVRAKGFLLNYETICNITLSGDYGVIESPGYPNNYPADADCLWTITVLKGSKINVTFTDFDLYQYHRTHLYNRWRQRIGCDSDYLQTKETSDKTFTNKFCGSIIPPQIRTQSNSLQIKFVSGLYFTSKGFRLEWVRFGCGGHIQKQFGTIKIEKSAILPEEMECAWLIESPVGTSITSTVSELIMTESKNCSIDTLEVYNGQSVSFPLITKICHTGVSVVSSTGNLMYVKFVKKSSLRDIYFISVFESSPAVCGGRINSRSGWLYSKNYPQNYDNNLDCIWFITVPINHRIELNILSLDLYSYDETDCDDVINIYDGDNFINSTYTYRICPKTNLTQIVTKNNNLVLQFITDNYGTAKGFKANFTMTCGSVIEALNDGIIRNDKYISHWAKNCTWTILAPQLDQKIKLTITYMSIPQNNTSNIRCPLSFLKIFDGDDDSAPLIGEYCGRVVPHMLVSQGSAMTIQFGTHSDMIDGHFSAHYSSLTTACGGNLTSEEGNIASPNYPLSYPVNARCEWILSTSPGNRVYITFEIFDLEYSEGCNEDYLEVRENNAAGELLGVYCGNVIPSNTTAATKLYIKFHSNNKNPGRGFVAHYGFLHGNEIMNLEAGEIASPLYPHLYEGRGEYTWRIITNGFDTIYISIDHLEIHQRDQNCIDYLVIYDGYDDYAPVLQKLCGIITSLSEKKNLKSTSNVVYIKLVLGVTNIGCLFHLQWTKSERNVNNEESRDNINCGSNITELILPHNITTFHSPNYPENYENNLNCHWLFKSLPGRHLRLYFNDISLEETMGCYADYISLYSSNDLINWSPLKDHICLSEYISKYIDSTSYLKLNFRTDSLVNRKGFEAQVKSVCGGIILEQSGTVSVTWLDLIDTYDLLLCNWTVKVRPGRNMKLNFDHFNITNNENECKTYVVLKNGDSAEAPVIGKYCGFDHENRDNIISSSNAIYVTFVRRLHFIGLMFQNFKLHFEEQNIECGGTSTLDSIHNSEIISSPNYPYVSVPFTECVWVFVAPPGEILKVDFIERFDLEKDSSCSQEFIEIRDGSSEYSPLIKRVCNERPESIKTSNNYMYVKYSTHLREPRDGFKANISIYLCGGTIISNFGEITSPSYPHMNLKYGTICTWHVISPTRYLIQFQLKDLDLPESESLCETKIMIMEKIPGNDTLIILKTIYNTDMEEISDPIETFTYDAIIQLQICSNKPSIFSRIYNHRGFKLTFNSSRPTCGATVTTSEGFLTTPGYPRKSRLGYCRWVIIVPDKNRRVRLELLDIDLKSQTIRFYNDDSFVTLIQRLTSETISRPPQFIESTGNKMALNLFIKRNGLLNRFKAKFSSNEEALCGGELSGLTGQLQSPDLNRSYTCEWEYNNVDNTINLNESRIYDTIYLNINITSTYTGSTCRHNNAVLIIKVNAENEGALLYRRACGNNTNVSYRLPMTSILIKAIQNYDFILNFQLEWQQQPCGGVVHIGQDINNIFNVPNNYNNTLDCGWILVVPSGIRLEIKLEGSFMLNCADEYLRITLNGEDKDHVIGDYCRDKMSVNPLVASFMYTHIEYHSKSKNFTNLKVFARTVSNQCGGILTMADRVFTSPNYPKEYPNNIECTWEIQAEVGNRISLQFLERFAIEDTTNCTKDVLIIYDWTEDEYTEIAKICGRRIIKPLNSTANKMKVTLRTDVSTQLDGFKARWEPLCGGKFIATEREQFIYSPGYPYAYSRSLDCTYEISGSGNKIYLIFHDFEFEGIYPECLFDNVTISSLESTGYLYETYCGKEMPMPIHNFYNLKITLKTDIFIEKKGFKLSYSLYTCGGIVKVPTLIKSNAISSYDNDMNCTWIIEAPVNKIVVFNFLYISLENSIECVNDNIGVFDGKEIDLSKRLALFCGFLNLTKTIRSNDNTAILQFVSDSSVNKIGFNVEVFFSYSESVGCGGRINLTTESSQILRSPLIGGNVVYENYLDCHWDVIAPADYVVKVEFKSFHVSPCANANHTALGISKCDCDVFELRDGLNPDSTIIGRYCGHLNPPQLISSRNLLSIRLSTDGEINSSGFDVLLSVQKSMCERSTITVSNSVQRWTTPGYESGSLPRGLHCTYDLDTSQEPYSTVQLTIHNLDIEPRTSDKCNKDKLVITGHSKPHNMSLGQNLILGEFRDDFFSHSNFYEDTLNFPTRFELCGLLKSIDFYVQGQISISISTSPENILQNHSGVELEVIYLGFCGRNYTGTQGRLQSTYENNVDNFQQRDCYTLITAPINHTITVYFIHMSPEYFDDKVFFKIFDGNNTDSDLLLNVQKYYTETPVYSTGRNLLFHSHANGYNMISYDAYYVTTDRGPGCGGTINNEYGKITSPLYPQIYRKESTCQWDIETPVGTRLLLRFIAFELGIACDKNYLELQDKNGNSLGQYCDEVPADHISTDNFIRILFVTTKNNDGIGWSANFVGIFRGDSIEYMPDSYRLKPQWFLWTPFVGTSGAYPMLFPVRGDNASTDECY